MNISSFLTAVTLTALSSASAATLWTTTFSGTVNNLGDASRTITNTPSGTFTDTLATTTSTLTRNTATGNYFLTGTGNTYANYNPNQNVDNPASTAGWNAIFDYGPGLQSVNLTDIVFKIYRFNGSGNVSGGDSLVRDTNITAEYTLNGGTSWQALSATQLVDLTPSVTGSQYINVTFTPASAIGVNFASDDFKIRYTVLNDADATGAYMGINAISFNGSVVPEPSALLLGSLGALVLMRRRR